MDLMASFSLCRILPAPKHNYEKAAPVVEEETAQAVVEVPQNQKKSANSMFLIIFVIICFLGKN
jgi:hypothetical protein